jgi:large subunit ribosomal protein L21
MNAYAVAQTSGKQFLIQPIYWYDVDFIKKGYVGDFFFLNKILLFRKENQLQIGTPFLNKSQILCQIIQQVKGPKILVLKTKPKKKYTRVKGHRQNFTRVTIK